MNCNCIEPKFDSDIVIVGAGPAGASAATYLARAGQKVILVDRQSFPRDKVCGDLVSPIALKELKNLGITSLSEYKKTNKIRRASLYIDGLEHINKTIPYIDGLPYSHIDGLPSYGRVIPRKKLDHWVFNAAKDSGAHTLEGYKVTTFENKTDGIEVKIQGSGGTRTLFTKLLIGADGSNSVIAKLLRGYSSLKDNRIFSVRAYFRGYRGPVGSGGLLYLLRSFTWAVLAFSKRWERSEYWCCTEA